MALVTNQEAICQSLLDTFKNGVKKGDLIIASDGANKFCAIAEVTGDYSFLEEEKQSHFRQMRTVKWLRRYKPSLPYEQLFKKSFSQKTIYNLHGNIDKDKLYELLASYKQEQNKPCVMIIDEINRGNISRIFGELITLIEPDKRTGRKDELSVTLPYSKEKFSVPANLYVIGTMNTADRSLTQLDYALRRRFKFVEMLPMSELLNEIEVHGISMHKLLETINQRIEALLDKDHLIGHSFFIPLAHIDPNDEAAKSDVLADIFEFEIIPLLREYFFDDWQRICWVLNDTYLDEQSNSFFKRALIPLNKLFNGNVLENLDDRRFSINKDAFHSPESYKNILKI